MDDSNPNFIAYLSTPKFVVFMKVRAHEFGRMIGVEFGKAFTKQRTLGVRE